MASIYCRSLNLNAISSSAFLFGPRMTGKSRLLETIQADLFIDLLDPERQLDYMRHPRLLWEQMETLPAGSRIIIDEIQRVPALLDYVQMGIQKKEFQFFLSGSSARKLRRSGANLLGGRAIDLRLHPLTCEELGNSFSIHRALDRGTLPRISSLLEESNEREAILLLKSYVTTYLKEEIQAEAIVRTIAGFSRFLEVAAHSNGQMIEYSTLGRDCSVPASTVKEYYSILEDTLLGQFVWPIHRSTRKKARPRFYFFDCGVVRALQGRLDARPSPEETGFLFETWLLHEILAHRNYSQKTFEVGLWREGMHEIDFLIHRQDHPVLAIECKSGKSIHVTPAMKAFRQKHPMVPLIVASLQDECPRSIGGIAGEAIEVLPWRETLDRVRTITSV